MSRPDDAWIAIAEALIDELTAVPYWRQNSEEYAALLNHLRDHPSAHKTVPLSGDGDSA